MKLFRQIAAITALNLRAMRGRLESSLVVVIGMALVVGVTAAILSIAVGVSHTMDLAKRPGEVLILGENARFIQQSSLSRDKVTAILDAPGIAVAADGRPAAFAQANANIPLRTKAGRERFLPLVATTERLFALRPIYRIIEGRPFQPGLRELVVGQGARNTFAELDIGSQIPLPDGPWTVVGVFATDGGDTEFAGVGDADTLMGAFRRPNFNIVHATVDGEAGFERLRAALDADPTLDVRLWTSEEYFTVLLAGQVSIYEGIAYGVGTIMALGTLAAALSIMYAAVSARLVEIATLRALGFSPTAIATSVLVEALLLAASGALIGAGVAWAALSGRPADFGGAMFHMTLDLKVASVAALIAVLVGSLAGLFPAIRAARLPVVMALQQR
ncbi:MAG: ABC transporter permease [Rhodospirillaceae bacterium]